MKDIIYREDTIELLERQKEKDSKGYAGNFCRTIVDRCIKAIENMPSAERTWNEEQIRNSANLLRALLIQSKDKDITLDHDTINVLYETLKSCLSN